MVFFERFRRARLKKQHVDLDPTVVLGRHILLDATSFGAGRICVGARSELHDFCRLQCYGGFIDIGEDCSINPFCVLYGHGGLTIGAQVRIAAHVIVVAANHIFSDPNVPIMHQPESRQGIRIGDDVWIGAGARILDGVEVRRGAVIAAGAVVTKDVAELEVVAGVPARAIGSRCRKSA